MQIRKLITFLTKNDLACFLIQSTFRQVNCLRTKAKGTWVQQTGNCINYFRDCHFPPNAQPLTPAKLSEHHFLHINGVEAGISPVISMVSLPGSPVSPGPLPAPEWSWHTSSKAHETHKFLKGGSALQNNLQTISRMCHFRPVSHILFLAEKGKSESKWELSIFWKKINARLFLIHRMAMFHRA